MCALTAHPCGRQSRHCRNLFAIRIKNEYIVVKVVVLRPVKELILPNSLNAKKRHRQNLLQRYRNRAARSRVRTSIRVLEAALQKGDKETAERQFQLFTKQIDTAAGKNIYHPNAAARHKSRLSKRVQSLA